MITLAKPPHSFSTPRTVATKPQPVAPKGAAETFASPKYQYDVNVNQAAGTMQGAGKVTFINDSAEPLSEVYLRTWANAPSLAKRGGSATVSSALVNGEKAIFEHDKTVLKIALPTPLKPGESSTIGFDLNVTLPNVNNRTGRAPDGTIYFGNALPTLAVRDDEGWNLDPYVNRGESFYTKAADWKVNLTAPEGVQLITSGVPANEQVKNGVRQLSSEAQKIRDFIVVAAKDYVPQTTKVGDTQVNVWTPKTQEKTGRELLDVASRSLAYYNKQFGAFGQPVYNVVATSGIGGGMEYPNVTLNDANSFGRREIVAHETAHQWFYGKVGNNQYDDPWLDESFTSYATDRFLNSGSGKSVFKNRMASEHISTHAHRGHDGAASPQSISGVIRARDTAARPTINISAPMHDQVKGDYFRNIYGQGPVVLERLRDEVGVEKFDGAMKQWVKENDGGIASTAAFIKTMSDAAGRDLTPWFKGQGVIPVETSAATKLDPNGKID